MQDPLVWDNIHSGPPLENGVVKKKNWRKSQRISFDCMQQEHYKKNDFLSVSIAIVYSTMYTYICH